MIDVRTTKEFDEWVHGLRAGAAQDKIMIRARRLSMGNPGKYRALPGGIFELKEDWGPGYRVYCTWRGSALVLLLCGGDKRTQRQDIARAKMLAARLD